MPASNIDAMMKHVGYRNIPFDHSIGMLGIFLNIFYPTDNTHSGELLGYYRQREWRLIGGELNFNDRPLGRPQDVDGRDKPGHDATASKRMGAECSKYRPD